MPYYSEDFIEEVISQNDIVDVISEYVTLTKSGRNFMGLCPFHKEKSPSFCVSIDKQIFKCFGCLKSGNVIKFVREIENMDFLEALELLADKAHIDKSRYVINSQSSGHKNKNADLRESILNISKDVAKYYHNNLIENINEKNMQIINYLNKRKIDIKTITKYGLGFANGKIPLFEYLKKLGYNEEEIFASSIIMKNEKGKIYDRFFNRLIFPIFDVSGKVIAFGGRVLDDSKPKYLNSAENVVYYKSKHLYMLNFAVKEKIDKILIVEGYMDALSLQKNGINYAVASLGTALTENQAKLIKKYTDNVIIGYDQDLAGQEATMRGMDILSNAGINVKVLKLDRKDVKDPDEYINKYGTERFKNCISESVPLVEYKISKFEKNLDMNDVTSKIKFLNNVAMILCKIDNNIERELYIDRVSEKYKISKDAIFNEVNKKINSSDDVEHLTIRDIELKSGKLSSTRKKIEQYIIALMICKDKKIYKVIEENITDDMITTSGIRKLYLFIKKLAESYDITKIDILSRIEDDDLIKEMTDVMYIDSVELNKYKLLEDVLKYMKKEKFLNRRKEIFEHLSDAISEEEKQLLQIELNEITVQLSKLK